MSGHHFSLIPCSSLSAERSSCPFQRVRPLGLCYSLRHTCLSARTGTGNSEQRIAQGSVQWEERFYRQPSCRAPLQFPYSVVCKRAQMPDTKTAAGSAWRLAPECCLFFFLCSRTRPAQAFRRIVCQKNWRKSLHSGE